MATNPALSLHAHWSEIVRRTGDLNGHHFEYARRIAASNSQSLGELLENSPSHRPTVGRLGPTWSLVIVGMDEDERPSFGLVYHGGKYPVFTLHPDGSFVCTNWHAARTALCRYTFISSAYVAGRRQFLVNDEREWVRINTTDSTRVHYIFANMLCPNKTYRLAEGPRGWLFTSENEVAQSYLDTGYRASERRYDRWERAKRKKAGYASVDGAAVKVQFFLQHMQVNSPAEAGQG